MMRVTCAAIAAMLLLVLLDDIRSHAVIRRLRYDGLTGALVRSEFMRLVRRRLRAGRVLAIIDLNGLKDVNDQLGHGAGDAILRAVAERIRRGVDRSGLLGRIGGDEFAVLVNSQSAMRKLQQILAQSLSVEGRPVSVACGAAKVGAEVDLSALLRKADQEMYQHKRTAKETCQRRTAGGRQG